MDVTVITEEEVMNVRGGGGHWRSWRGARKG